MIFFNVGNELLYRGKCIDIMSEEIFTPINIKNNSINIIDDVVMKFSLEDIFKSLLIVNLLFNDSDFINKLQMDINYAN